MFAGYDTDKDGYHSYGKTYAELFAYRNEMVTGVLELGIFHGGSLLAFRDRFPYATIVGVDRDPTCMRGNEPRIVTILGNDDDPETLKKARKIVPTGYDLIVDDASHRTSHQLAAFRYLWKAVRIGGFYVVEDLHFQRNGTDLLNLISSYIRGKTAIRIVLGDGSIPADDLLVLERTSW